MPDKTEQDLCSTLINRNIVVNSHRTSVRLEAEMWNDLRDICRREDKSVHDICTLIADRKHESRSLTSAIRVFLIAYYRAAATEEGHDRAGHGQDYRFMQRNAVAGDLIGRAYNSRQEAQAELAKRAPQHDYAYRGR